MSDKSLSLMQRIKCFWFDVIFCYNITQHISQLEQLPIKVKKLCWEIPHEDDKNSTVALILELKFKCKSINKNKETCPFIKRKTVNVFFSVQIQNQEAATVPMC